MNKRYLFINLYQIELPDDNVQYVIFAAEPYENIAFKIPNLEIESTESGRYYCNWDREKKVYTIQLYFRDRKIKNLPSLPQKPMNFNPIGVRF